MDFGTRMGSTMTLIATVIDILEDEGGKTNGVNRALDLCYVLQEQIHLIDDATAPLAEIDFS